MIKSRSVRVLCLVIALLLSISIIGFSGGGIVEGGRGGPGYHITWSPPTVSAAVTPGGSWEGSVSFSSSIDLLGAELSVAPELAPFVTIDPQSFPTVVAGTLNTVHIRVAVPDGAEIDLAYEGTIRLTVGRRTYPQPLKVNIYVAPPLETMTEESYNETLELEARACDLFYDSQQQFGTEEALRVTLEFLSGQDQVFDAGISEGGSIWVVYKDGIHAVISTSPPGAWSADYFGYGTDPSCEVMASSESRVTTLGVLDSTCYAYGGQASDAVTALSGTYVTPGNKKAILLWPFCSDPSMQPTVPELTLDNLMEQLSNSLAAIGYEVTSVRDEAVTVDRLKSMYSYGLVDLLAHGEVFSDTVVIVTGEEATSGSTWTHRDDLRHHRLLRRSASPARFFGVWCHWAIRPPFVSHYATEPYPNSLIVANCCQSLYNLSMADAFVGAGAHVYVGWSGYSQFVIQPWLYPLLTQGLTIAEAYPELVRQDKHICEITGATLHYYPSGHGNLRLFHPDEGQPVYFACPNLEAAIREAIGKPTGPICRSDLAGLTYLSAGGSSIADLTGLEYCTDLVQLYLWNNQISDVSPLAGLTSLWQLSLGSNPISDISPLADLTGLWYLGLGNTLVTDLWPLSNLPNLGSLGLFWLGLTDISVLAGLTGLYRLDLDGNEISDISPLGNLTNLAELWLGYNQISNIWPLAGLTNIHLLDLSYNQISDIKPLVENPGLDYGDVVDLCGNRLSDDSYNIYIPELDARGVIVYYEYF